MRVDQRQKRVLAVLLVVLLGVALVQLVGGGGGSPLGVSGGGGTGTSAAAGAGEREVVDLRVAALQPRPDVFEIGRDPFRYGPLPTPPPPPPTPPPPPPTPIQRVVEVPVPPPGPPKPVPPSPDHLRFLGSFGPADRRIAVVLAGGELHNVREGAVLEGRFQVREIGFESLAIAFVGFPDEPPRRLPVGGG